MVLGKCVVLAGVLVDNSPITAQILVNVSNGVEKVPWVRKSVTTERSEIWKLPHTSPDFGDVTTSLLGVLAESNAESNTSLNDTDFAGRQVDHTQFGLDVQVTQLRADQEITVSVAKGTLLHRCVDHVDVERDTFADVGVTRSGKSVQTVDEIDRLIVGW